MTRKEKLEKDIALLEESVAEKWLPILHGDMKDKGSDNCPLCKEYPNCAGCPIRENTGEIGCSGTPYRGEWLKDPGLGKFANSLGTKKAALNEAIYLKNLASKLREEKKKLEQEEEEKKIFHPLVFYITLNEPTPGTALRLELRRKVRELLKEQGIDVASVEYSFHEKHDHMSLDSGTGCWLIGNTPILKK